MGQNFLKSLFAVAFQGFLIIASYYMKDKTPAENADFLRREFVTGRLSQPGGKGFQIGMEQTSVWFDETGITLGRGKTALHAKDRAHVTWEQAAVRVRELMDAGLYVTRDVMDEALVFTMGILKITTVYSPGHRHPLFR